MKHPLVIAIVGSALSSIIVVPLTMWAFTKLATKVVPLE